MERHWHWVDVQSGEVTKTVTIPNELVIEEILFATATTPMAKASNRQGDQFLVSVKNKELLAAQFEETKPPATQPTEKSKLLSYVGYFGFPDYQVVFYQWYYGREPGNHGFMAGDISGLQWAIRDLATDTLMHADKYVIDPTSKGPIRPQHRFVTMLSPRHLVFQENQPDKPRELRDWLTQLRTWLGMDDEESVKLLVIDGARGRFLQQIHVPPRRVRAISSRDGQTLTVMSSNNTRIEVRSYGFPLRQPWMLIWSWSLGMAVLMTMVVELKRWRSQRKLSQSLRNARCIR